MITVERKRIIVETRTLRAVIERGVVTEIRGKPDGKCCLRPDRGAADVPLELIYIGPEAVSLGGNPGDRVTNLRINDTRAELRVEAWNGDGVAAGVAEHLASRASGQSTQSTRAAQTDWEKGQENNPLHPPHPC